MCFCLSCGVFLCVCVWFHQTLAGCLSFNSLKSPLQPPAQGTSDNEEYSVVVLADEHTGEFRPGGAACSFIHSFIQSITFISSFVCSFINSFIPSSHYSSFIYPLSDFFDHPFVHLAIQLFSHFFILTDVYFLP